MTNKKEAINITRSIIALITISFLSTSCSRGIRKPVKNYPSIKHFFLKNKWCVIVNPFTASPETVKGFSPKESKALAESFANALMESGFAAEASTDRVTLCKKRVLIMNGQITKRNIEKRYGLIVPHIFLLGIPAILGWPTTREKYQMEIEVTVRIKSQVHIVGIFRANYNYDESNNIYKSDQANPMLHPEIPLQDIFGNIIQTIKETLTNVVQPKEIIRQKDVVSKKSRSFKKGDKGKKQDPNTPTIPKIPGTPGMITPRTEPIPWEDIF